MIFAFLVYLLIGAIWIGIIMTEAIQQGEFESNKPILVFMAMVTAILFWPVIFVMIAMED